MLADTDDCLHLKETEARERMHFILFRVFPIFLLLLTWYIIQTNRAIIPMGWNYVLIAIAILTTSMLFFRSYITEIKITANEIYMLQKTVSGPKEISIPINDIEKVILRKRRGKASGAFFTLHTRAKKSYWLLNIPMLYTDEHHISLVKERLQQMLRIKVEGD